MKKLFAIDGQHRVEGIKQLAKQMGDEAFKEMPDELCTIFVAHKKDRQLECKELGDYFQL